MSETLVYDWLKHEYILFVVTDGAKHPRSTLQGENMNITINIHNGTGDIHAGPEHHESLPAASPWQIVRREPARLQLSEPERARLFAPDVDRRADELFTRPYHLTVGMRCWIADEIDGGSNH